VRVNDFSSDGASKAQGQLQALQKQLVEAQGELSRLVGLRNSIDVDEAAAKRAQGARSDAEYRLNEAKNRAEELEKDIDALTQRREALRSEIDNIKNAPAAAADPVPVAPPQSVFPPRRTESAPVNIAPRVASPAPRPTPRPAPRTPLVPN
jgi:seryl-tRNA synthetase